MNILTPHFWTAFRFWSKVDFSGPCWKFQNGEGTVTGYGRFRFNGKSETAHRAAYRLNVGPIPTDMTIDHVKARGCTSRRCVNFLEHFEIVTGVENSKRAEKWESRKTHCPQGHEYNAENTYFFGGKAGRQCMICMKARSRKAYRDRKAARSSN